MLIYFIIFLISLWYKIFFKSIFSNFHNSQNKKFNLYWNHCFFIPTAVGPGASKSGDYKNPEYYLYNNKSYFDLEVEMMKDRIKQPASGNEHF